MLKHELRLRSKLARIRILGPVLVMGVFLHSISAPTRAQTLPQLPTLMRADQIRQLTPEQAALGYPVRIKGVITMDAPAPDFFIQDETAGIYVEGSLAGKFPHVFGKLVELEGVTGPGKFAPVIRERALRALGDGTLPKAQLFAFSELSSGQQDSQWVRIRGIIQAAAIDRNSWREMTLAMRLASGGGEFSVRVPLSRETDVSSWVDREVLIEGVCGSLYNLNRQLTGILFYVPRLGFIKTEAPAREASLSDLLRFSPDEGGGHRVRVRGIVGFQQPGHALFLQGQGQGLRVLTQQETPLHIGDVIEVVGFPVMGESAPMLKDSVFRVIGHQQAPEGLKLDLNRPWEQFDGALVTTEAKLLNWQQKSDGVQLSLQQDGTYFDATLPPTVRADFLRSIPLNSEVQLTGICLVRSGGLWRTPQSFRMLLHLPQDVVVLQTPSWWNLPHTLWLLGITGSILLVVVVWVLLLRRRLHMQMALIRQKLQSSAVLEERNRIARELHDTLEQELAGITMQLDLAVDCLRRAPQVAERALETARKMSRHSMIEARRSVWDLRCQLLEHGDLIYALSQIVAPLAPQEVKVETRFQGIPARLPRPVEMNLLRIGQEAVANAVKHGHPHKVLIELKYSAKSVGLCVSDDGQGFKKNGTPPIGHFGLLDMHERAQSMGSQLNIESNPGCGTRVVVNVDLTPEMADGDLKANTYSRR